jgi:fatty acid-binding protein DegV
MDYLYSFVAGFSNIEALGVEHTTTKDVADNLAERMTSVYKGTIFRSIVSPVLGVHGGPGAIAVTVLEAEK